MTAPALFELQLVTADVERLASFYEELLAAPRTVQDDRRGRVHLGLEGGQLIFAAQDAGDVAVAWPGLPPALFAPADTIGRGPGAQGPVHFAIRLAAPALDAALERAGDAGVELRGPHEWPGGMRSWYLLDPDGNVPELVLVP